MSSLDSGQTFTVRRPAGPIVSGTGDMIDPWDVVQPSAEHATIVAAGVAGSLVSSRPVSSFNGGTRQVDEWRVILPLGTPIELGDSLVDEATGDVWRVRDVAARTILAPHLAVTVQRVVGAGQ